MKIITQILLTSLILTACGSSTDNINPEAPTTGGSSVISVNSNVLSTGGDSSNSTGGQRNSTTGGFSQILSTGGSLTTSSQGTGGKPAFILNCTPGTSGCPCNSSGYCNEPNPQLETSPYFTCATNMGGGCLPTVGICCSDTEIAICTAGVPHCVSVI